MRLPLFLYRVTLSIKKNLSYIPIFAACLLFSGLLYGMTYGTWIQTIVVSIIYFAGVLGLKTFFESAKSKDGVAWKKMLGGMTVMLMMWFCLQFLPA
jgi:hypothetical protein